MHIQLFMCENVHKFWSTLGHAYTEYSMDGRKGVHSQLGARAHKKHYRIDEEPLAVPVCKRRSSTIPAYNSRSDASNTLHHFLLFLQLSFRRPSADLWAGAAGSGNCDRSSEGGGEKKEKKSFLANVNNKTIMEIRLVMQPTLRLAETPCGTYNTHQEGWFHCVSPVMVAILYNIWNWSGGLPFACATYFWGVLFSAINSKWMSF